MGTAVGKCTNAEDRREVVSVIVRTILGIITTFLLLCRFSGCISLHCLHFFIECFLFNFLGY